MSSVAGGPFSVGAYVAQQQALIDLEQGEERELDTLHLTKFSPKDLESQGICLTSLVLDEFKNGLYGRTLCTLVSSKGLELPPHQFTPRDVVLLRPRGSEHEPKQSMSLTYDKDQLEGIVYSITSTSITIAFSEKNHNFQYDSRAYNVYKTTDTYTFDRYRAVLRSLPTSLEDNTHPASGVLSVLYMGAPNQPSVRFEDGREVTYEQIDAAAGTASQSDLAASTRTHVPLKEALLPPSLHFTPHVPLNPPQQRAVLTALAAPPVTLVHGPPGTGKSTVLVEIVRQCVARGERVLVCAASNTAVDQLVERIAAVSVPALPACTRAGASAASGLRAVDVVRVGHPARTMSSVVKHTLDHRVDSATAPALAADRKTARQLSQDLTRLSKHTAAATQAAGNFYAAKKQQQAPPRMSRADAAEAKRLQSELRAIGKAMSAAEAAAAKDIMGNCDVIACTLTGACSARVQALSVDVVVIDECAQALEVACLAAVPRGKRLVMAGDHLQLPPTIHSDKAATQGLEITMFERLVRSAAGSGDALAARAPAMQDKRSGGSRHAATLAPLPGWLPQSHGDVLSACTLLCVQHRMHRNIMKWSSDALYGGRLVAHPSVAVHTLFRPHARAPEDGQSALAIEEPTKEGVSVPEAEVVVVDDGVSPGATRPSHADTASNAAQTLESASVMTDASPAPEDDPALGSVSAEGVRASVSTLSPWVFIDTVGEYPEDAAEASGDAGHGAESKSNRGECALAVSYIASLLRAGVRGADVCVITPYRAQVRALREAVADKVKRCEGGHVRARRGEGEDPCDRSGSGSEWSAVEVGTVDGFQGREKDAVVVSCVRSNPSLTVGFLSDCRRMNVAVTRARKHVCVIGDSATLCSDDFLAGLVDYGATQRLVEVTDVPGAPEEVDLDQAAATVRAKPLTEAIASDGSSALTDAVTAELLQCVAHAAGVAATAVQRLNEGKVVATEDTQDGKTTTKRRKGMWWVRGGTGRWRVPAASDRDVAAVPGQQWVRERVCVVLHAAVTAPLRAPERRVVHLACESAARRAATGEVEAEVETATGRKEGDERAVSDAHHASSDTTASTSTSTSAAVEVDLTCVPMLVASSRGAFTADMLPTHALFAPTPAALRRAQDAEPNAPVAEGTGAMVQSVIEKGSISVLHVSLGTGAQKRMLVALLALVSMEHAHEDLLAATKTKQTKATAGDAAVAKGGVVLAPGPKTEAGEDGETKTPAEADKPSFSVLASTVGAEADETNEVEVAAGATVEADGAGAAAESTRASADEAAAEASAPAALDPATAPHVLVVWGKLRVPVPVAMPVDTPIASLPCCPQHALPPPAVPKGKSKGKAAQSPALAPGAVSLDSSLLPLPPAALPPGARAATFTEFKLALARCTGVRACVSKVMCRGRLVKAAADAAAVFSGPAAGQSVHESVCAWGMPLQLIGAADTAVTEGPLAVATQAPGITETSTASASGGTAASVSQTSKASNAVEAGTKKPMSAHVESAALLQAGPMLRTARTQASASTGMTASTTSSGKPGNLRSGGVVGHRPIPGDETKPNAPTSTVANTMSSAAKLVYGAKLDREVVEKTKKISHEDVDALLSEGGRAADVDTILDACVQLNNQEQCAFKECRRSLPLGKNRCAYCGYCYCVNHGNPMFHGCEDAVTAAKRAKMLQPTPLNAKDKAALADKFAKAKEKLQPTNKREKK